MNDLNRQLNIIVGKKAFHELIKQIPDENTTVLITMDGEGGITAETLGPVRNTDVLWMLSQVNRSVLGTPAPKGEL